MREIIEAIASVEPTHTGFVCADLEVEWDNQPEAAERFAAAMKGIPGDLFLTTWADPIQQGWKDVARALSPVVRAWIPQQYNDWLAAQESQLVALGESCLQPAVDLSGEFGGNHPVAIAQNAAARGQTTVWIWEWQFAMGAFRQEAQSIVATLNRAGAPPSPPAPSPQPALVERSYVIQPGDTLTSIAERLRQQEGFEGVWQDLFQRNRAALDAAARGHGHADSDGGNLIFVGTTITFLGKR